MPTVTYMSTMTQTRHPGPAACTEPSDRRAPRARLISGRLALALLSSFGALTSFYLLLSVTPMYAVSAGAGSAEAGVVTGSLMLATVVAEFASARLMRRYGYRRVFAAGALLLGGPALALLGPHSVIAIVAVSIARGVGFGLNTVVIGALVATALPADRRGEGIGLAGVVACLPAIVALPSGVWLAENTGYAVVIAVTAVSALAPLAAIPWLTSPADHQAEADPGTAHRPACSPACDPAASCGRPSSSRLRPCRLVWSPHSCHSRPACPAASPPSGCSCRPSPRRRAAGGPGATVTGTATPACWSRDC